MQLLEEELNELRWLLQEMFNIVGEELFAKPVQAPAEEVATP